MAYVEVGVQYCLAARHSYFCQLIPVAANLFHHAFEMLFKAKLLDQHSPDGLKAKYRHDLHRLWRDFKALMNQVELDKFDAVVEELQKWEDVRYPTFSQEPSVVVMSYGSPAPSSSSPAHRPRGRYWASYSLSIDAVDELLNTVITVMRIKRDFRKLLRSGNDNDRRATYERGNLHQI